MEPITVCIVDDNTEIRLALQEIINLKPEFKCIATYSTVDEAIRQLPLVKPNVVLMDINLEAGESGIDCVRAVKPRIPATNFMMCTVYEESEKIFEALRAGANGYILKKTPPAKLLEAIKELHQGGAPMSSEIARKVVASFTNNSANTSTAENLSALTKREVEILEFLSRGMMYKEIALALELSVETIRKHVYHIYDKLHVSNRVEAINKYFNR